MSQSVAGELSDLNHKKEVDALKTNSKTVLDWNALSSIGGIWPSLVDIFALP